MREAMTEYIIGLDSGTSSCKVIIVDSQGNVIGKGTKPHKIFSPAPNYYEQHPKDWWIKFREALKEALFKAKIPPRSVIALGVTAQRSTVVPVDENGNALRPAICWMDARPSPKYRWIKEKEPEIYKKAFKIVDVQSWLIYKLTGEWKGSKASPLLPTDDWNWDTKLIRNGEIPQDKLPEYKMPGEVVGYVKDKIASLLGLPKNLPVVCGCGDKPSGTIGAGCTSSDKLVISYGTSLSIGTTSKVIARSPLYTGLSGIPGLYNIEMGLTSGFWMTQWFKNNLCKGKISSVKILDLEASKLPAGSDGLLVVPYWIGPDWSLMDLKVRGIAIGWTSAHTIFHFYRAIIEGLIFEARRCKEIMENCLERDFKDVRIIGGGSNSDFVLQTTADIFGQHVNRIQTPSAEALGAAILASKGVGLYRSIDEAVKHMVRITKRFKPNSRNFEVYDDLYRHIYKKIQVFTIELYKSANANTR